MKITFNILRFWVLLCFVFGSKSSMAVCVQTTYVNRWTRNVTMGPIFYNDGAGLGTIAWHGLGWEMLDPTGCMSVDSTYQALINDGYQEPPFRYVVEGYLSAILSFVIIVFLGNHLIGNGKWE